VRGADPDSLAVEPTVATTRRDVGRRRGVGACLNHVQERPPHRHVRERVQMLPGESKGLDDRVCQRQLDLVRIPTAGQAPHSLGNHHMQLRQYQQLSRQYQHTFSL
jgi:hypothetical protein